MIKFFSFCIQFFVLFPMFFLIRFDSLCFVLVLIQFSHHYIHNYNSIWEKNSLFDDDDDDDDGGGGNRVTASIYWIHSD
mgnify:CR=1 FL=1